jgi:hypothetical protein
MKIQLEPCDQFLLDHASLEEITAQEADVTYDPDWVEWNDGYFFYQASEKRRGVTRGIFPVGARFFLAFAIPGEKTTYPTPERVAKYDAETAEDRIRLSLPAWDHINDSRSSEPTKQFLEGYDALAQIGRVEKRQAKFKEPWVGDYVRESLTVFWMHNRSLHRDMFVLQHCVHGAEFDAITVFKTKAVTAKEAIKALDSFSGGHANWSVHPEEIQLAGSEDMLLVPVFFEEHQLATFKEYLNVEHGYDSVCTFFKHFVEEELKKFEAKKRDAKAHRRLAELEKA